ncbi:MAG: hypothetical protein NTZ32_02120 [Planctomycetales bacterium]|nr:hypothetical protein [Planctomycetales bacterium]
MHTMGKVGIWLVVVAAVAATMLTSKLIQVRNGWTKKASVAREEYRALVPKLAELQEQLDALEGDRFRALELWGNSSPPVPTTVQAQGALVVDLGTNSGITEKKVVYGFEVLPDNSVVYRGDFTVATARDVQSQLTPNWKVRNQDGATWQSSKWRWRNQLPSAYQQNFDKQILLLSQREDDLAVWRRSQDVQTKLVAQSQEQLKLREAELVGGDQLSKNAADAVEHREGLVAAVEQVEESRNQVLTKVDDLRRKLRTVQTDVDRLKALNVELTDKLPQPEKVQAANNP